MSFASLLLCIASLIFIMAKPGYRVSRETLLNIAEHCDLGTVSVMMQTCKVSKNVLALPISICMSPWLQWFGVHVAQYRLRHPKFGSQESPITCSIAQIFENLV